MSERYEVRAKHLLELAKWTAPLDYGRPVLRCLHFRLDGQVEAVDGFRLLQVKGRGQMPGALAGALVDVRAHGAGRAMWHALLRFAKEDWVGVSLRRRKAAEEVVFEHEGVEAVLPASQGMTYPDTDAPLFRPTEEPARVVLQPRNVAALTTLQLKGQAPLLHLEVRGRSKPVIATMRDAELEVELRALVMPMHFWGEEERGKRADVAGGDGVVPGDDGRKEGRGKRNEGLGASAADHPHGPGLSGVRSSVAGGREQGGGRREE